MKLKISIFYMKESEIWNSGLTEIKSCLSYLVDVESGSSADK